VSRRIAGVRRPHDRQPVRRLPAADPASSAFAAQTLSPRVGRSGWSLTPSRDRRPARCRRPSVVRCVRGSQGPYSRSDEDLIGRPRWSGRAQWRHYAHAQLARASRGSPTERHDVGLRDQRSMDYASRAAVTTAINMAPHVTTSSGSRPRLRRLQRRASASVIVDGSALSKANALGMKSNADQSRMTT
jgi:hypothetical protein